MFQFIYVEDVDATLEKAVKLGATLQRAAETQFYGDRDGYIVDPFGHGWTIASHVEDVTRRGADGADGRAVRARPGRGPAGNDRFSVR